MPAIPVHHTAVNTDRAWDGPAEEAKLDTPITGAVAKGEYGWYDETASDDDGDGWPDAKNAYKFPHHFVTDGKPGEASLKGVDNAKARLSQADIPDADRAAVEKHLQAHQDDAEKEQARAAGPARRHEPIRSFQGSAKPYEPFWRFVDAAQSDSGQAEMELYGVISEYSWFEDDISPKNFKRDLYAFGGGGPILLKIDSPGGDVFAASTMRTIMMDYPGKITARIDGIAASAAVLVTTSAQSVSIMDSAYMMIHDPYVIAFFAVLDIDTLGRLRASLQSIKEGMLPAYQQRTGLSADQLSAMMTRETWMNAQDAITYGFADEILQGGQRQRAQVQNLAFANALQSYLNVPPALLQRQTQAAQSINREVQDLRDYLKVYR